MGEGLYCTFAPPNPCVLMNITYLNQQNNGTKTTVSVQLISWLSDNKLKQHTLCNQSSTQSAVCLAQQRVPPLCVVTLVGKLRESC